MPKTKIILFIISLLLGFWNCSDSGSNVNQPIANYDNFITTGWTEFSNQNYSASIENFNSAKDLEPEKYEAYNGLGWSHFKEDQLSQSITEFSLGSQKSDSSADISAGWAFVLNADKKYAESNIRIDTALTRDANWTFSHGLDLNQNDLIVLKAENFYLLGQFAESLSSIQLLNPSFVANILTSEGRASLAMEIERLRGSN